MNAMLSLWIMLAVIPAWADSKSKSPKVVWDAWYTVLVKAPDKEIHYEYYNDRVLIEKKGQIIYQNQVWKNEEGFINEEHLGAVSEDTEELKPIFFNFRAKYRDQDLSIDGNVENGDELHVKVIHGKDEAKPIKKRLESKTFLSSFFPVWLRHKLSKMRVGKEISFKTIQEDNLEKSFDAVNGAVRLEKKDDYAKANRVQKLKVIYQNMPSTWYVKDDGEPVHVVIPEQGLVIDKVSKEEAEAFLKK